MSSAGVAQQLLAQSCAPEHSSVRQRDPVAAALHLQVDEAHVQRASRVCAEGRSTLELVVNHEGVLGAPAQVREVGGIVAPRLHAGWLRSVSEVACSLGRWFDAPMTGQWQMDDTVKPAFQPV